MSLTLLPRPLPVAVPVLVLLPFICVTAAGPCDPTSCAVCSAELCADEDHWLDDDQVDFCIRGGVRTVLHRACHEGCRRPECQPE